MPSVGIFLSASCARSRLDSAFMVLSCGNNHGVKAADPSDMGLTAAASKAPDAPALRVAGIVVLRSMLARSDA